MFSTKARSRADALGELKLLTLHNRRRFLRFNYELDNNFSLILVVYKNMHVYIVFQKLINNS
jgi:hypothetical protein